MTGKLRSAYLTAAKTNRVQDVTRIMAAAERLGQAAVRNICKKWLEQHQQ
jgi:zinc finger FYVE domain-containing protein 26